MITTAHVYTTLFLHLGVILVITAYYTVGAALLPGLTARSAQRMAARPMQATLVGLAISLPWMIGAIALMAVGGPVALGGIILASLWVLVGLLGGAGIAQHVGRSRDGSADWRCVARGGLLLVLTWALPLLGWLVALPLTVSAGVGCFALGMLTRRPPAVAVA